MVAIRLMIIGDSLSKAYHVGGGTSLPDGND